MKAAVFYGPKEALKIEDVRRPEITPWQVLVRIRTCGICSGDVQRLAGLIKVKTPIILGHEPAGTIVEVGSEVKEFHEGEDVIMFATGCGECYYCKIGKDNVCDKIAQGFGLGRDGGYAEYAVAYPRELLRLPEGLPFEAGSVLTASTGTVFHATRLAQVSPGDTAVIYGTGCLGTQALQLLKIMGARVIAVDIVEEKLDMASALGADEVINAREKDPVREVKRLTEGRGADVAFEIVGLPETMLQAIDSVRRGGKIMDIGSLAEPITLKMRPFLDEGLSLSKELSLITVSHCPRAEMVKLLELVRINKIDFEMGTAKVPLDDINRGFEMKREGKNLRVVITP
jgi:D-arabinose 1-dehydrogenase-like Zn-dependent alcohol dehydrogenase